MNSAKHTRASKDWVSKDKFVKMCKRKYHAVSPATCSNYTFCYIVGRYVLALGFNGELSPLSPPPEDAKARKLVGIYSAPILPAIEETNELASLSLPFSTHVFFSSMNVSGESSDSYSAVSSMNGANIWANIRDNSGL
mmetsp:Transcript_16768/g.24381  ORF Transcript_16768/g.24381 Transcript_16768/m.24381 type:complete len:138 (+) Transcript_16768:361-774(+)